MSQTVTLSQRNIPWTRQTEIALIDLVYDHRFLWDHNDPLYPKRNLRKIAYDKVGQQLRQKFHELQEVDAEIVRVKFKNLRSHWAKERKKVGTAAEGKLCAKWEVFDHLDRLFEPFENAHTESGWTFLPSKHIPLVPEGLAPTKQEEDDSALNTEDSCSDSMRLNEALQNKMFRLNDAFQTKSEDTGFNDTLQSKILRFSDTFQNKSSDTFHHTPTSPLRISSTPSSPSTSNSVCGVPLPNHPEHHEQTARKRKHSGSSDNLDAAVHHLIHRTGPSKMIESDVPTCLGNLVGAAVRPFSLQKQLLAAFKIMEVLKDMENSDNTV